MLTATQKEDKKKVARYGLSSFLFGENYGIK